MKPFLLVILCAMTSSAQVLIASEGYNNSRTVANTSETILTPSNVNSTHFGKVATFTVDEAVYAQPLYIPGSPNLLIVATMNDSIYAFNADTLSNTPVWTANLRNGHAAVPFACVSGGEGYIDPTADVGILSTPVYDPATHSIWAVAFTFDSGGMCTQFSSNLSYHLHAISITNGSEKFSGPFAISGPSVYLNSQRTGLAVANGQVYVGFASWGDLGTYSGFITAHSSTTGSQTATLNLDPSPTATQGAGVWMAGRAPAIDSNGSVYFTIGNGDCNNSNQFGQSFIRLSNANPPTIVDWWQTADCATLNMGDQDIGSSGPILISGKSLIFGWGKDSKLRLVNTANMGHEVSMDTNLVQTPIYTGFSTPNEILGGPTYFNSVAYVWPQNGTLQGYNFNGSTFDTMPVTGSITGPTDAFGPALATSANGTSNAIIWASAPKGTGGGQGATAAGILYAIKVSDRTELWDSDQAAANRDAVGKWSKFRSAVVDNGKVFLGTNDSTVVVFGLLAANNSSNSNATISNATIQ